LLEDDHAPRCRPAPHGVEGVVHAAERQPGQDHPVETELPAGRAVRTVGAASGSPLQAPPRAAWAGMCLHFLRVRVLSRRSGGAHTPAPMWAVTCEAAGVSGRAWYVSEGAGLVPRKPRLLDTVRDALRLRHYSRRTEDRKSVV